MDSSISSIVGQLGGGSGVDMVKLASDLAAARFAPRIDRLQSQNEILEAQVSAAGQLRSQLSQLASALGDRMRNGDLAPTPRITAPGVASVSVQPGAAPSGQFSLEVSQLASAQMLALPAFSSADDIVGEGTLTLTFGRIDGASFIADADQGAIDIGIDAADSLQDVATKINASGSGVIAYVATGTEGAQLILKGEEGAENGFIVDAVNGASGNLSALAWEPGSDSGQLRGSAQDALFSFDTIAMSSASNKITDLPGGIGLDLGGTNVGAPALIDFASKDDAISAVTGDLVAALNDIAAYLRDVGNPLGGELGNDGGVRAVKRALSSLTSEVIMPNAPDDAPRTLSDLGISVQRDGSFTLDQERFDDTMAANPVGVAAMFTTGLFGIFATIDDIARSAGSPGDPGSIAGSISRYERQLQRNDAQLATIAEQQERLRERMTKTFIAAETNISASQSTLGFLRQQIDIWNAQSSR